MKFCYASNYYMNAKACDHMKVFTEPHFLSDLFGNSV